MKKAETLSFPPVIGYEGHGQSLHGEILVGAKRLEVVITLDLRCEIQLMHRLQDRNT